MSAERRAARLGRHAELLATHLLAESEQMLVLVDREGLMVDANAGFLRLVGLDELPEAARLEDYIDEEAPLEDLQLPQGARAPLRLALRLGDGSLQLVAGVAFGVEEGTILFGERYSLTHSEALARVTRLNDELTALTRELTRKNVELQEANRTIERLLVVDPLTGVATRRHFEQLLGPMLSNARRLGQPLTLTMIDLDHFKSINDGFGHEAGDEVLRGVGAVLLRFSREGDLVARIGGEEFVLALPGASLEGGAALAERIRREFETLRVPGVSGSPTASFGIAALHEDDTLTTLMRRADEALYRAKRRGRNRVIPEEPDTVDSPLVGPSAEL